jgi:hypothetical protein
MIDKDSEVALSEIKYIMIDDPTSFLDEYGQIKLMFKIIDIWKKSQEIPQEKRIKFAMTTHS